MKKSKIINKNGMIKANPNVNSTQLDGVLKLIKELRGYGVSKSGYNIVSPFSHRPKLQTSQEELSLK